MARHQSIFVLVLLVASFSQVNSDLYTPSMPAIVQSLSTSTAWVQRSLSIFLLGFAVAQCVYGLLSDSLGRRRPLLVGLALGLVGSGTCLSAHHINTFLIGRCLQGLGAGCGLVLARSILRDCFKDQAFARTISYLSMGTISIMASAPALGGCLQEAFGWHGSFAFLSIYGLIVLLAVYWALPETLSSQDRHLLSWKTVTLHLSTLMTNRVFLGYCGILFAVYGGMLTWLAIGPLYFQNYRHLSPSMFGCIALLVGGSSAVGAWLNAVLVTRFDPGVILQATLCFMLCVSLVFLTTQWVGESTLMINVLFLIGYIGPTILVLANTLTKALSPFGHMAGIGFAVVGFVQIIGGASVSALLSMFSTHTLVPLAATFVATSGLSWGVCVIIQRRSR